MIEHRPAGFGRALQWLLHLTAASGPLDGQDGG
jgi:hypothetical protein